MRVFNIAHLSKWEWKIREAREGLWYRALVNRYRVTDGVIRNDVNRSSLWWKDICNLDLRGGELTYEHYVK